MLLASLHDMQVICGTFLSILLSHNGGVLRQKFRNYKKPLHLKDSISNIYTGLTASLSGLPGLRDRLLPAREET